ncbi:L10-interacting MYB domain-containing protein-like [Humulus lupulus]|uniref:L10-interacting MYB domain-containing protein-like n=1 Tax=Humulus lupulus TaxID=3486 RepID=UPI002B4180F7|nr:L10-interacting MYB domain-containing protein-like [Humulus lupulus]
MASEGEVTQGKSKTIWDPPTREKWIDLVVEQWQLWDSLLRGETGLGWDIQRQTGNASDEWWDAKLQKYLDVAKFRVRGLEHSFKLDELFRDVTATGARAWAPTSGSLPPLYTEDHNDIEIDENLEESDHEGVGDPMKKETKLLGPNRKQFKMGKKNNSTTSKLSKQLDEICEAIKNRSSYIRTDPPGCSVQEVIDKLVTLLGCEPMSPLFKVGTSLFTKKANRKIFVALKEPKYQIEWLKEQEFDF